MLVLSRRIDESIIIEGSDGPIEVRIVRVQEGERGRYKVKLAIEAPKHVTVDRSEVYESKQKEKQQ